MSRDRSHGVLRSVSLRDPPQFPVIIGVTGHRRIAPDAEQPVRDAVRVLLRCWRHHFGPALHVLTALADGADQLVADIARDTGVPVIAVAPFEFGVYQRTIANRNKLQEHWDSAALRLTLPPVGPGEPDDDHVRQYEQLGVLLVRRSHLLLGLWDGVPDPVRGGTFDILRMRLEGDHGAEAFRRGAMFLGANSFLDETNRGPLLHILAPRDAGQPAAYPAGSCRLLALSAGTEAEPSGWSRTPAAPAEVLTKVLAAHDEDFTPIDELNRAIGRLHGSGDLLFDVQLGYLNIAGVPPAAAAPARVLQRLQAGVDTAARIVQFSLLGSFVPARNAWRMLKAPWDIWRTTKLMPKLGAVFFFTAALPLAVLFFELFVEQQQDSPAGGLWYILGYLLIFGGTTAWYRFHIRRLGLQERFQDYRALAEALRVQLYWGLAAVPASVSDHYLRKQSGELGWIQFALRGPSLWAASVAEISRTPAKHTVTSGWIENQQRFFEDKAELHKRAAERGEFLTTIFVVLGVLGAVGLLTLCSGWSPWPTPSRDHRGLLIVLTATLPGVAAFFSMSAELRNYEPHEHAYALMRRMFRRAAEVTGMPGVSDSVFQEVVREIGREALAENAEWLVEHRHHKIEPR